MYLYYNDQHLVNPIHSFTNFFFFCKIKCFTYEVYINLVQKSFPIITINWVVTNEMLIFIIKLRVKRKKKKRCAPHFISAFEGVMTKGGVPWVCLLNSFKSRKMLNSLMLWADSANTDALSWNTQLTSSSSVPFRYSTWQIDSFWSWKESLHCSSLQLVYENTN